MQARLTLKIEDKLIKNAREYAKSQHKSLSQIVAEFFSIVSSKSEHKKDMAIGPVTSKLAGSLKGARLTEDDYKDYLLRKYL
jgi:hypothetical protein